MVNPSDRAAITRLGERLDGRLDNQAERMDTGFDRLTAAIDAMADSIRRLDARTTASLEAQDAGLQRELDHLGLGVGELRDSVTELKKRVAAVETNDLAAATTGAAEGAARGAGQAARLDAAEVAKTFWKTGVGKLVAICAAFTTIMVALGSVPSLIRGIEAFWTFLGGAK